MLAIIGKVIAQLRDENSMSVEELSRRSGVSVEKIMDIEAARIMPSLMTIFRLSRVLGSRIASFDATEEFLNPRIERDVLVIDRRPSEDVFANDHHSLHYFSHLQGNDPHLEPLLINLAPMEERYDMSLHCGDGEIFLYVLQGQIEVHYPQDDEHTRFDVHALSAGDSAIYKAENVHYLQNKAPQGHSRVLLVAARQL